MMFKLIIAFAILGVADAKEDKRAPEGKFKRTPYPTPKVTTNSTAATPDAAALLMKTKASSTSTRKTNHATFAAAACVGVGGIVLATIAVSGLQV